MLTQNGWQRPMVLCVSLYIGVLLLLQQYIFCTIIPEMNQQSHGVMNKTRDPPPPSSFRNFRHRRFCCLHERTHLTGSTTKNKLTHFTFPVEMQCVGGALLKEKKKLGHANACWYLQQRQYCCTRWHGQQEWQTNASHIKKRVYIITAIFYFRSKNVCT